MVVKERANLIAIPSRVSQSIGSGVDAYEVPTLVEPVEESGLASFREN
jgi:hypothetical protein